MREMGTIRSGGTCVGRSLVCRLSAAMCAPFLHAARQSILEESALPPLGNARIVRCKASLCILAVFSSPSSNFSIARSSIELTR